MNPYRSHVVVCTVLLAVVLALSTGSVYPVAAATGSLSYNPALNFTGPACASSAVGISFTMTATVDDFGIPPGFDMVSVVLFDGNGKPLSAGNTAGLVIGTTATFNSNLSLTGITARPVTVKLLDTSTAVFSPPTLASVTGKPVLGSFSIDPATLFASCASVPLAAATACGFGDGRVDGKCWDRIAVYCNTSANPPNLDVWGIDTTSKGFRLTTFPFSDIAAAGPRGLTKNLGSLGKVSVMVDANNSFWVAWNGKVSVPSGSFIADGQPNHGFAKGFQCNFAR
jgi:hypothetical protein